MKVRLGVRVAVAVCVVAGTALIGVPSAGASAPPAVVRNPIDVSPTSQAAGARVGVSGGYFDAWTTVSIGLDSSPVTDSFVRQDGQYGANFNLPSPLSLGAHTLSVTGLVQGASTTATTTITVIDTPVIVPVFTGGDSPKIVPPGSCGGDPVYVPGGVVEHVVFSGGYSAVDFSLQGRAGTIGTGHTDTNDTFVGSVTLPADVPPGPVTLVATLTDIIPFPPPFPPNSNVVTFPPITVSPVGTPLPLTGHDVSWHPGDHITGDATGLASFTAGASSFSVAAQSGFYVRSGSYADASNYPASFLTPIPFANSDPVANPNVTQAFTAPLYQADATICSLNRGAVLTPGGLVIVTTPSGTTLSDLVAMPVPATPTPPAGVSFPYGLIGFKITGVTPGAAATVTLDLPGPVTDYWKLQNGLWSRLTSATFSGNRVTLTLTDGGTGDADGAANGVIVDPGAPATSVVIAPPVVDEPPLVLQRPLILQPRFSG